nr:hypothetical protein [Tanacetum cinerariifolium]
FEGHIREPPQISSPINQHSRDDVPEDIYRHMAEQDRLLKEAWTKVEAHDSLINQMNAALQVTVDHRPQHGSSHNHDVSGVIPDVMNRERRESHPMQSPPYKFYYLYNDGWHFPILQQVNFEDCGVATCWLIDKFCMGEESRGQDITQAFFDAVRVDTLYKFYNCRCEDTAECGYD